MKKTTSSRLPEGITQELLDRAAASGRLSPVLYDEGAEPVTTLPNGKTYFVKLADGSYLKENGAFVKKSQKETLIARARYLLHYGQAEALAANAPAAEAPVGEESTIAAGTVPSFGVPLFTARFDNPEEMRIVKAVFGRESIEHAFREGGGGMAEILEKLLKEKLVAQNPPFS